MKTILYILERYFFTLSSAIFTFFLASLIEPDSYGLIAYKLSVVSFLSVFSLQCLEQVSQRECVAKLSRLSTYITSTIVVRVFFSVFIYICLVVYSILTEDYIYILLGLNNVFICFDSVKSFYVATNEPKKLLKITSPVLFLSLIIKVVLVSQFYENLYIIALALVFDLGLLSIAYLVAFFKMKHTYNICSDFDFEFVYLLFKDGKYLFVSALFLIAFSTIDQMVVGKLFGFEVLANYSIAIRISSVFILLSTAFNLAFVSKLDAKKSSFNREAKKMILFSLITGFISSLAVGAIVPYIFDFVFKDKYPEVSSYLPFMSVFIFFAFLQSTTGRILVSLNLVKYVLVRNFLSACITFTGFFIVMKFSLNEFWVIGSVCAGYFTSSVAFIFLSKQLTSCFYKILIFK